MTPNATTADTERAEAARLTSALLRFSSAVAHPETGHTPPGVARLGTEAFVFSPAWTRVPLAEVEAFLVALPSPALLSPSLIRGSFNLTLIGELSGERRQWGEKTLSNQRSCLETMCEQLGLDDSARILLEFEEEAHVFSLPTFRYWAEEFAVDVGWNLGRLDNEPRAEACMLLIRADGRRFTGRSDMLRNLMRAPGDRT